MISSRVGAALALGFSLLAVALAVVAFMSTVREETTKPGRLVQTRINSDYFGDPVLFPVDDFFIGYDLGGDFYAYYVYPPGFYGHTRGCKLVYDPTAFIDTPGGVREGPGLYIDPCGGARFNRDGELIFGAADRGLDFFGMEPGVDGVIVDTRKLFCGASFIPDPTSTPTETPTSTVTSTPTPSPTPLPNATATLPAPNTVVSIPTSTTTSTATKTPEGPTATATKVGATCDRVTGGSKQR